MKGSHELKENQTTNNKYDTGWQQAKSMLHEHTHHLLWLLLGFALLTFVALCFYDISLQQKKAALVLRKPLSVSLLPAYPVFQKDAIASISAESAIVIDDTSHVVLYRKNPLLRFSMASTTKIMTALVASDYYLPDSLITVQTEWVEGAHVGFVKGEKVRFADMLYALLLPSGNDAALALAQNYPGGTEAFVAKMNEKAALFGLHFTHYGDSSGLDDDSNYTTVGDLAKLASVAMQHPVLANIVATRQKTITTDKTTYELRNLHKLLGQQGVVGVKTGYTEGAGEVLVTSQRLNGRLFIIVVMKSTNRFGDTQKLLDALANRLVYITLLPE